MHALAAQAFKSAQVDAASSYTRTEVDDDVSHDATIAISDALDNQAPPCVVWHCA